MCSNEDIVECDRRVFISSGSKIFIYGSNRNHCIIASIITSKGANGKLTVRCDNEDI